ncbi:MAG: UDP-glucose 6-dehydrogenase [Deltaproteobacteria bacterium]|nr:MAG: UDP-glucose 6-dehydrogenase [Deltaproteobacteria bacterium]
MNVCIVGTGYVGLVSAACFAEMGNTVQCVDTNPDVVAGLQDGKIHIFEPGLDTLVKRNASQGRLHFTTDLAEGLKDSLFAFICVGTPPQPDGTCDLKYVHQVAREIGQTITSYTVVVDKSTVPVGTADEVRRLISQELASRGAAVEFDVVSNPEFLKEGDAVNDFLKPDRVVVGTDNVRTAELLRTLYAPFARSRDKMIVMGIRSAEMTKYASNCMLATKISFINEVANICEKVGADVREVRHGIGADHRIGYQFIYPGIGYGGSCFPKDVKALINTSLSHNYDPELLQAVDAVNDRQKLVLADKITTYFAEQGGVQGKTLAMWGLAFKANTDDTREASSLAIIHALTQKGMKIQVFDPVAGTRSQYVVKDNPLVTIVDEQYQALDGAHALAVVTDWNQFRNPDFQAIRTRLTTPVLFDGRNLYGPELAEEHGLAYFCIGRRPVLSGYPS